MKPETNRKYPLTVIESVPITHRVFSITGFVFSGWVYFTDSKFKFPDPNCFAGFKIPEGKLVDVYTHLNERPSLQVKNENYKS